MFDKFTVEISKDEIQKLITEKFKQLHPGFVIKNLTFTGSQQYDMRNEPCGYKFDGAKIALETNIIHVP